MPINMTNHHYNRNRSRSRSNSMASNGGKPPKRSDLWKGAIEKDLGDGITVQMVGMDSENHTVYARVDPQCPAVKNDNVEALKSVPLGKVIEVMVDEGWRHAAKDILEKGKHVEPDSYPSANELLKLGAVWLLNEAAYAKGDNAHAKRLSSEDEMDTPSWEDMTLRVHYVPERFLVAHEVDWTKYCRELLLDGNSKVVIGANKAHVPMTGLPDKKDGVIMYEDEGMGVAVLNKPGGMPTHPTITNHAEDVTSMYTAALKQRHGDEKVPHVSIPVRMEPEMNGLLLVSTKKEFCAYMTRQLDGKNDSNNANDSTGTSDEAANATAIITTEIHPTTAFKKSYRCLICIKDPDDIDRIEKMVGKTLEHYVDVKTPAPKKFVRNKPKSSHHEWQQCHMRITRVGGSKFRAACVSSKYSDSNDFTLAHRLWNPNVEHPAEEIGVSYVMQVEVELLTARPHQLRGQLATLGCPIVGDYLYGGGVCEMKMNRHTWMRMAAQVCDVEFALPKWEETEEGKKILVPSEAKCVFHLASAWWTEYLVDYERYL